MRLPISSRVAPPQLLVAVWRAALWGAFGDGSIALVVPLVCDYCVEDAQGIAHADLVSAAEGAAPSLQRSIADACWPHMGVLTGGRRA